MKQDEIYSEEKEFSDSFLNATKSIGRGQLKSRLKLLDSPTKVRKLNIYWIAASIAILICASIFLFKPPLEQNLYSSNYHKMPNKVVAITRGASDSDALKLAFIAYEQGRYEEASDRFLVLSESNPEVNIYLGIIAMEESEFNTAIDIFSNLILDSNQNFKEEAKWYLALSYIKIKQNEKAIILLQELEVGDSSYASKAKEMLKQL